MRKKTLSIPIRKTRRVSNVTNVRVMFTRKEVGLMVPLGMLGTHRDSPVSTRNAVLATQTMSPISARSVWNRLCLKSFLAKSSSSSNVGDAPVFDVDC